MRKLYIFGLIGLAAVIIGLAWAEQITLSTYYPAPYGVYKTLKANVVHLSPIASSTYSFDSTEDAMLICDSDNNVVKRWDSTANSGAGDWVVLGGDIQSTQVVGTTDASTTSTSWSNMPDMSVAINTSGGDLLVIFSAPFNVGGNNDRIGDVRMLIDSAQKVVRRAQEGDGSEQEDMSIQWVEKGLPADLHTITMEWKNVQNGIHQTGSAYARILTVIEF